MTSSTAPPAPTTCSTKTRLLECVYLGGVGGVANTGTALDGSGDTDTFYDIEAVRGSSVNDTLQKYGPTGSDPTFFTTLPHA
jgi:hypothetical protein